MEAAAWNICTNVSTTCIQDLIRKAWEELGYLCKYKRYVKGFENKQGELSVVVKSVELRIEEAKKVNKTRVEPMVEHWLQCANKLLQHDPESTKCFGLCMNCFSQIAQAKELESLMIEITTVIAQVDKFAEVAREAGVPGMEYHSQEFMSFESRKAKFEKLKKELEDDHNYMIGLHGMGGTGKSTMAIEVGKHVEKSNAFDRVIFISVSTPVDKKKIRDDIAKKLELQLEEEKKWTHAEQIWNRIAYAGKVLIILDDVWEELNLKNMGIQPGFHRKGHCSILLTTRHKNVCTQMGCQKKIKLEDLDEKDALKLFLFQAMESGQHCPNNLKNVAIDIVNECGRLPIIIVAVAKTLKDSPVKYWHDALIALKSTDEPSRDGIVGENVLKFYKSLKLSYTHLNDKEAQVLFLLCSIFPKSHEIPVELLSRIAIGLGLFGEVDKYYVARSQVRVKTNKLINSSLLLTAGEECVKVHDVIREVALEIANEEIQVIMNSETNLKENMKYSSWIISGFPHCSSDSKLEVLLVWINENGSWEVPNTVFGGMKSLRVLILNSKIEFGRTLALSLSHSIQSLEHIRTLSLTNWELGDVSVLMGNLQKLESLELTNCSIIEFPNEIRKRDKLRVLALRRCYFGKNNPFEVIATCSLLEELYYVSNNDHIPIDENVLQITPLPKYQIYHIDGSDISAFDSSQLDTSIKKCFKPAKLQRIFSKEVIKYLAARAEILELKGDNETGWSNVIPDIASIEDGAMNDLIKLSLKHWAEIKCLIHTDHLQLESGMSIMSNLAQLQLIDVDVREICCGRYPDGFLKQLERLEFTTCQKLESTLFKGKLELGNLKSIEIEQCSMTCLFYPSTAQSLRQLEMLKIADCYNLEYIIREEGTSVEEKVDDKDPNLTSHDSIMFPKLKLLHVKGCGELEFILPICFCEDLPLLGSVDISQCRKLKYMFGQYSEEEELHQMQKEITLPSLKVMSIKEVPSFVNIYPECYLSQKPTTNKSEGSKAKDDSPSRNISWGPLYCFLPKSKTTNKDEPSTSKAAQPDRIPSQEKYVGDTAPGIFIPPLYPCYLREMNIIFMYNLSSLFSVSIASSMLMLEKLHVEFYFSLEHIVKEEVDGNDHMNANSIFPSLRMIEILGCVNLKYVFPASCSRNLMHLESVHISWAKTLKYVFGKSCEDDNSPHQNRNTEIRLPALNKLCFERVPIMVSMCAENYYVKAPSLQDITLGHSLQQFPINSFIDLSVEGHRGHEQLSRIKLSGMNLCNLKHLGFKSLDVETIYDLQRLEIASPVNSSLKTLKLEDMDNLRNICVGPKTLHMSFQNIFKLEINKCHRLKYILSSSISRSLPYLRHLEVSNCADLEHIIEDDDGECYFPNLRRIFLQRCNKLKYLFSVSTCGVLPQLSALCILHALELEQVFGCTQELHIKHVFPNLFVIWLEDLPVLHTICHATDFQPVIYRKVLDCPNISLTSTDDTQFIEAYADWLVKSESNKPNMDEDYVIEQRLNRFREVSDKAIKRDRPTAEQYNGLSNIKEIAEASVEKCPKTEEAIKAEEVNDLEQTNKPASFAAPSQIESPQSDRELHLRSKDPESKASDFPSNTGSSQVRVTVTPVREGEADADIDMMMIPPMDPKDAIKFSCLAQLHVLHNTIEKIDLKMPVGIVGLDPYSFGIDKKDLNEFLSMQEIDIAWVQLAILYFHNICTSTGRNGLYGFLCPAAVQKAHNTLDWRMRYVGYVIGKDKLPCYLTPIVEGFHWMLCVACPIDNVVYWFDSLGHSPSSEIQTVFNTALKTYLIGGESSGKNSPTTWIQLNCPRQRGNKDCGYYVIRYMYEIIHSGSSSKFEEIFNNKDPYTIEDINFIRDLLAKQLLQELFSQKADRVKDSEQTNKPAPFAAPSEIDSSQETGKPNSHEGSQGKEVVMTHLSQIHVSENSKVEAQARKAELKDQISKLQAELAELDSKEKETEV